MVMLLFSRRWKTLITPDLIGFCGQVITAGGLENVQYVGFCVDFLKKFIIPFTQI